MHHVPIAPIIPSADEARLAETARAALAAGQRLTTDDLPPIVTRLLMDMLAQTAAGNAIEVVPVESELTTQQAADLLNVSLPYLIGLVESRTLPARMIGAHRRLPLTDVLAYKAKRFVEREQALDEMLAIDQELGLI